MDSDLRNKLQKALKYGGDAHTLEDVAQAVLEGEAQAWYRGESIIVTQIEENPQCKMLRFWIAAGDIDELLPLSDEICEWGKAQGCTMAHMVGRKGWKPVLAPREWNADLLVYRKEL